MWCFTCVLLRCPNTDQDPPTIFFVRVNEELWVDKFPPSKTSKIDCGKKPTVKETKEYIRLDFGGPQTPIGCYAFVLVSRKYGNDIHSSHKTENRQR